MRIERDVQVKQRSNSLVIVVDKDVARALELTEGSWVKFTIEKKEL